MSPAWNTLNDSCLTACRLNLEYLAAVDVADDLRIAHVDLAVPALSLARIDGFARRHGLTRTAVFVEAVNRWAMQEAAAPRERRGSAPEGPTLFDLANPLELRVEPIAAISDPQDEAATREREASEARDIEARVDDITAELVRLYSGMSTLMDQICASYGDAELELLADFLRRVANAGQNATDELAAD